MIVHVYSKWFNKTKVTYFTNNDQYFYASETANKVLQYNSIYRKCRATLNRRFVSKIANTCGCASYMQNKGINDKEIMAMIN